jgi:hypothetical protein
MMIHRKCLRLFINITKQIATLKSRWFNHFLMNQMRLTCLFQILIVKVFSHTHENKIKRANKHVLNNS